MSGLLKALSDVSRHHEAALESLELLRTHAEENRERQIVVGALRDHLFDDLLALDRALAEGGSEGELARLRAVPAAVLRWAAAHMSVETVSMVGDEREVSASAMDKDKYEWKNGPPARSGELVAIRIVTPGWKWRGKVLAKPVVEMAP